MTEYDYSPEALERFLSTQDRIARWVVQTEEHRPQFDSGEPRKPSIFQRLAQRTRSHSYHEPPRRRDSLSSSSSSSSSTTPYSSAPQAPGPMPYHSPHHTPPMTSPYTSHSQHRPSHSRHHSSHHHSSYRAPVYLMSPPTSPPITGYPYSYGSATNSAPVFSAGSYAYPTAPGVSSAGTPSYLSSPPGYFPPNASYPAAVQAHAQVYSQRPSLNHSPQSAPLPTYHPYGQPQSQPMATAPAQYPQSAAYPPAIYPLAAYGPQQQQQLPPKPVFYQRIFSGSRSGTKKGSKRRSS